MKSSAKARLTKWQRILVAGTLFGMFFGAGNLIFPVHLGQMAGRNVFFAILGFVITAVGFPILGVAAIGNTHADGLQGLANKVGKKYSIVFTSLLYLTIGPFFAIPRCASTSFTTGISPLLGENMSQMVSLLVFSVVFFALVLFFSLRPGNITVWIGKMINPAFLALLFVLVIAALRAPGASVDAIDAQPAYQSGSGAFISAMIEGYGTMDAIAGLAFGIVVIDVIRRMGVTQDADVARDVLSSGILTGALMALIYVLTILIGAQSRGLFALSENGGIALAQIFQHYLGNAGSIVLAITITLACLKTSIGLVTSCAEAFVKMFPNLFSYRTWAIIFTVFSFCISNIGLSAIIGYSLPVLMLLYPPAITLILLALCGKWFGHDRRVYISVTAFTWAAAVFDFLKTLPDALRQVLHLDGFLAVVAKLLPLYAQNLGWVLPALLGLVVGLILHRMAKWRAIPNKIADN